jgi:hypothetical protein
MSTLQNIRHEDDDDDDNQKSKNKNTPQICRAQKSASPFANRRLLLCPAQLYLQELNCSTANICRNSREPKNTPKKNAKKNARCSKENTKTKTQIFWVFLCTLRYLFSTYIGECSIYSQIYCLSPPRPTSLSSNFEGFYDVLEQLYPCSVFGPNVFV